MSSDNPSSPWRGLPDELKAMILEYALLVDRPCHLLSRSLLVPFLLTSKHMSEIALEVWGKSKMYLSLHRKEEKIPYIDPNIGRHVRNLTVNLLLSDAIRWDDIDSSFEFPTGEGTPWRMLLSCKHHRMSSMSTWQLALPNLSKLKIRLYTKLIDDRYHWYGSRSSGSVRQYGSIEQFLATASCDLRAEYVSVGVVWFGSGIYTIDPNHPPLQLNECAKRIAEGVKALIENKKM